MVVRAAGHCVVPESFSVWQKIVTNSDIFTLREEYAIPVKNFLTDE